VSNKTRDERGASLVLAIVFMVVIGAIGGATLSMVTSGANNRASLDVVRDRQYAADAAIEHATTLVRQLQAPGPALAPCFPADPNNPLADPSPPSFILDNGIRVNCTNVATRTFSGFLQRNVIFNACLDSGADCTDTTSIVRAQINFQAVGSGATVSVTRTWVQSWSVNR
jgi:Tfp pilus assembly protein PilX